LRDSRIDPRAKLAIP
jgi:hypothetical protein